MSFMLLSTYLGLLGVVLVLVAYVLLQAQKLSQNSAIFYVINLIGSILILGSLYFHPNLPSVVIEIAWLIIGISSIIAFIYYYFNYGLEPVKPLLLIIPVSGIFYYSRRQRGKKMDAE